MRKYIDNGRRGRAPNTTWYFDYSAEARRFGMRHRVFVQPELHERLYDMLAEAGEEPDEFLFVVHLVATLVVTCRLNQDSCHLRYEILPTEGDRDFQIPILADFCTDDVGDCFVVQLRSD